MNDILDYYGKDVFESMKGQLIINIEGGVGDEEMIFTMQDGSQYILYYDHDCCASCEINDICGDLGDLLNSPLVVAEVSCSQENPEKHNINQESQDSFTWSFYKLDTVKGGVTIRWYGESNGYYSEVVTCVKKDKIQEE